MMESSTLLTTITVRVIVDRGMDELSSVGRGQSGN